MTRLILVLAALLVAVPHAPARAQRAAEELPPDVAAAWERVAGEHRRKVEDAGIVGSSLALVVDGRLVARQHLGMADLEKGRPVDERTLWHWGSITKTLTAVAILQLRDHGLLDLDDPVVRWVPELRGAHNPFGPMEQVTLRHLLAHSAGFRSSTWPWHGDGEGRQPWEPWEPTEWSQLVALMPYTRVEFEPGSRHQYSNPGYVFLGRVIEAASGDVFEHYIEKNLFRPLGMRTAYFDTTPWHLAEYRSQNYHIEQGRPVPNGDFNTGVTVANGGLNASVDDLARWLAFLTSASGSAQKADAVLSRVSLKEMWREVLPTEETELGAESIGLGFFLYPERGLVGHTGTQHSFMSFILFDPERRMGVVGAFNTAGGDDSAPDASAVRIAVRKAAADEIFHRATATKGPSEGGGGK